MGVFQTCALHEPRVAPEHLKCGCRDRGLDPSSYFHFSLDLNGSVWPVATMLAVEA